MHIFVPAYCYHCVQVFWCHCHMQRHLRLVQRDPVALFYEHICPRAHINSHLEPDSKYRINWTWRMHRCRHHGAQVGTCSSSLLGTRGGAKHSELAPQYLYIELYYHCFTSEDPTDKSQIESPSLFLLSLSTVSSQALRLTSSSRELSLIHAAAPKCGVRPGQLGLCCPALCSRCWRTWNMVSV